LAKSVLGLALAMCLLLLGQTLALAFVEDTPPTFENGGADPTQTGDPASVAAAQQALAHFFEYTNSNYSIIGYSNPRIMREELGNGRTDWLDRTMAVACGRLVNGWKYLNWVPGFGWCDCAAPLVVRARAGAAVPCEYTPPVAGSGGADPNATIDPPAVAAVQLALSEFYQATNRTYSLLGYSNPQVMRQERGNVGTDWLDQSLSLARGQLVGGWKNMNWVPGFGWCHCSTVRPSLSAGAAGRWEYSFADRALVAHLPAAETAMAGAVSAQIFPASVKSLLGDFAVEVRAIGTRSARQATYGFRYSLDADDYYRIVISPAAGRYGIWAAAAQRWIGEGRLTVPRPADDRDL